MLSEHYFNKKPTDKLNNELELEFSNWSNMIGRDFLIFSNNAEKINELSKYFTKHRNIKAIYISVTMNNNFILYLGFNRNTNLRNIIDPHEDLMILTNKYWDSLNCYTLMNLTGEFIEPDELNELIREEVRQQNLS